MKLTKDDLKNMEVVGSCKKGEIIHLTTKGGLHIIAEKTPGGEMTILSQGPHRAIALHPVEKSRKDIAWNEELYKSEDMQKATVPKEQWLQQMKAENRDEFGNPIYESTPQNHYDLAMFHSKMAGRAKAATDAITSQPPDHPIHKDPATFEKLHNSRMNQLAHSDIALSHYQAGGLSYKQANDEHAKNMQGHMELQEAPQAPFADYPLQLAWQRANPGKRFPKGLGHSYTK